MKITAISGATKSKGQVMFPHVFKNGKYAVQKTNLRKDQIYVSTIPELLPYLRKGYRVRMSVQGPNNQPSLIALQSLTVVYSVQQDIDQLDALASDESLDGRASTKTRKEQQILRRVLLANLSSECVICGHTMSDDMLVAAHIKRRSECTVTERRDYLNVASLMCKLGCDALFEVGYVGVADGIVVALKAVENDAVKERVNSVLNREVNGWHGSEQYYKWHSQHHIGVADALCPEILPQSGSVQQGAWNR